ncbi:MAG: pilus assembly FimT family protein [Cyanobacterium sp.]
MKINTGIVQKLFRSKSQQDGYTLPEILVAIGMLSILGAIAIGNNPFGRPNKLNDAVFQLEGILRQTRSRAIATTSAIRIEPDPDNPSTALKIESATTRGCEAISALSEGIDSDKTEIPVLATRGFNVGDRLKIGNNATNNQVIGIDNNLSLLILGQVIGSAQPKGAVVELLDNWNPDGALLAEDLTFGEPIEISSNVPNDEWRLCFDSRGLARLYDGQGIVNESLEITITDTENEGTEETIQVLRGGAVQILNQEEP